jgi:hypothetical protein
MLLNKLKRIWIEQVKNFFIVNLEKTHVYAVNSIFRSLLYFMEYIIYDAWHDPKFGGVLFFFRSGHAIFTYLIFITLHCKSFSRTCLSIRKYGAMIPLKHLVEHIIYLTLLVNILLVWILIKQMVKLKWAVVVLKLIGGYDDFTFIES